MENQSGQRARSVPHFDHEGRIECGIRLAQQVVARIANDARPAGAVVEHAELCIGHCARHFVWRSSAQLELVQIVANLRDICERVHKTRNLSLS